MSQLQKIDKQVHIASILVCANDTQRSFKSASWFRRNEHNKKLIKREFLEGKSESVYACSLYDFGSFVDLQLESSQGLVKEYEYGPIKLDKKAQTLLESELSRTQLFPVTVVLNKNQKYQAQLSFSKTQSDMLAITMKVQGKSIQIQLRKPQKWSKHQQLFGVKEQAPQILDLNLGQNKIQFVRNLSKFNIYCHYGNFLHLTFKSQANKNLFLLSILTSIEFNSILKSQKNSNQRRYSLRFSEINHLFASTDCFSDAMTPATVNQNVLEDFRNIVFTPKPELEREVRERGFTSLENFLGLEESHHRQSQKVIESIKTNETIKAIKQQQIEQETQARNRSFKSNTKSHQFIFVWNKNRQKLKQNESKQKDKNKDNREKTYKIIQINNSKSKSKDRYYKHLSYEQLLERNKFLEEQSRRLLEENIRLKHRIHTLMSSEKDKSKDKDKERSKQRPVPQFIREKLFQKNGQKESMNQLDENRRSESRKNRPSELSKLSRDRRHKKSEAFGLRDSTPNSPSANNFAPYLEAVKNQ